MGGVAPGDGDTAIIANGHTVTIPSGTTVTVGASPADDVSTAAIAGSSSAGTGILVINGTLIFRGTIQQPNATWTVGPGAILRHDSSAAVGTPSYTWTVGMANNQTNAKLVGSGTSGSHITIDNAASSGRFGGFNCGATGRNATRSPTGEGSTDAGRVELTYADLTSVGGTATEAFSVNMAGSTTAPTFKLHNCVLDDCGPIIVFSGMKGDAVFSLNGTIFKNPAATSKVNVCIELPVAKTTGTREIVDCVLEGLFLGVGLAGANAAHGFVATRSAFGGVAGVIPFDNDGGSGFDMSTTDCLVWNRRSSTAAGYLPSGTHTRLSCWRSGQAGDDDMWRFGGGFNRDLTIAGCVYSFDSTMSGDFLVPENNPTATTNITLENILMCQSSAAGSGGDLITMVASGGTLGNMRVTVRRCTHRAAANLSLFGMENTSGGAGCVVAVEDNLVWAPSSANIFMVNKTGTGTLDDASITVARNNAIVNASGDAYVPDDAKFGSAPGSGDITSSPNFVDSTRTAMTWASNVSGGSVTTLAGAWTEIVAANASYQWYATSTGFYDWVREGFRPRTQAYRTSAHDGSYIGAVPVRAPGGLAVFRNSIRRRRAA